MAINIGFALGLITLAPSIYAAETTLDSCLQAVAKEKPGTMLKLERLNASNGKALYEVEVRDKSGAEWEFVCDVADGKIIEKESEVSNAQNEAFKKNAKITEQEASAIALKAHPGKIQEIEYEIEADGSASYEIDIVSDAGIETKVEVEAATGKIIETATEIWAIGEDADKKH